ncbi:hypothetical protein ACIRG5_42455 [Lentzea sp. NPDC102401]|uniref:hypothetical protein n=1 Tax=Lentzea sp. NPDC102401 TaxID=3364128 RepID=UPI0037F3ADE9
MTEPQTGGDLPEFRVAVTVFTTVRAVDHRDALNRAEAGVARALLGTSVPPVTLETPHPRIGTFEVNVEAVVETGAAARNGYLGTVPTAKAYPD